MIFSDSVHSNWRIGKSQILSYLNMMREDINIITRPGQKITGPYVRLLLCLEEKKGTRETFPFLFMLMTLWRVQSSVNVINSKSSRWIMIHHLITFLLFLFFFNSNPNQLGICRNEELESEKRTCRSYLELEIPVVPTKEENFHMVALIGLLCKHT